MLFRQLFDVNSSTYTYLLARDTGRPAILIDPVQSDLNKYLKLLEELNLTLYATLDTHVHADHITASGLLRQHLGAKVMMGEKSIAEGLDRKLKDNDVLTIDDWSLTVWYTPGHTDDSYSFLTADAIFTGDALFIRGSGRTDFQNGSAQALYDTLYHRILSLPDSTKVYPGHDYNGMTVSTIGEERLYNPRLQAPSREAFVTLMSNLNLAPPKLIDVAVPANRKLGL